MPRKGLTKGSRLTYDNADLIALTDALDRSISYFHDVIGCVVSVSNPQGATHRTEYDAMSRVTQITDPLSHMSTWAYDAHGNLSPFTDARGGKTQFVYDGKNRRIARTL